VFPTRAWPLIARLTSTNPTSVAHHRRLAAGFYARHGQLGPRDAARRRRHFVRIDRGIVAGAPSEPNARAVLLAMATFARQTGAFVIAEGIEDGELLGYVRTIDRLAGDGAAIIQGGQGYGLGRPSTDLPAAGMRLHGLAGAVA
jgi:hypothetical protein